MKNVVIAQSGGPTAVINNSIRGAIDVLAASKKVDRIYAAKMALAGENDFMSTIVRMPKDAYEVTYDKVP